MSQGNTMVKVTYIPMVTWTKVVVMYDPLGIRQIVHHSMVVLQMTMGYSILPMTQEKYWEKN